MLSILAIEFPARMMSLTYTNYVVNDFELDLVNKESSNVALVYPYCIRKYVNGSYNFLLACLRP